MPWMLGTCRLMTFLWTGLQKRNSGFSCATRSLRLPRTIHSLGDSGFTETFDLGRGQAAKHREIALYSPVLAVLGTETDTREDWLAAGQALANVLLRA